VERTGLPLQPGEPRVGWGVLNRETLDGLVDAREGRFGSPVTVDGRHLEDDRGQPT
jgi:hypothetical protein